jgi:hypothetical protein
MLSGYEQHANQREPSPGPRKRGPSWVSAEGFDLPIELIQRTPNDFVLGRCGLSVERTRIPSMRRAIRLNMPAGVR